MEKLLVVFLGAGALVFLILTICLSVVLKQSSRLDKVTKLDSVQESTYEYPEEEEYITTMDGALYKVKHSGNVLQNTEQTENTEGDYILPESNKKYYKKKDLKGLTKKEVKLARNEIYARHGRIFTTDEIREYFESKDWYTGTVDEVSDSKLNKYEIANRDLIVKYEKEKGWN